MVEDPDLDSAEVVLEIGTDFTTVEQAHRPSTDTSDTTSVPDASTTTGSDSSTSTDGSTPSTTEVEAPTTSPTTVIGHVPGEPPEGVDCG